MKRSTVVAIVAGLTLVTGGASALVKPDKASTTETTPLVQQVERQEEVLDNHEARITNVESDVSDLQTNTGTAPSIQRVEVPVVTTEPVQSLEPVAEPEPVTVVSYRQIPVEGTEDTDCEYTYSDGTTYRWNWKTVTWDNSFKKTNITGYCDDTALGKEKPK